MVVVGVGVVIGVVVTVGVEIGVAVEVGVAVTGAVLVGVADAVAVADVVGVAVAVGDMLGTGVVGATVAGEVTCPEPTPVIWGVQAVTVTTPAANSPTSPAVASRRLDWPLYLPDRRPCSEAGAGLADVSVLVGSCHMTIPSLPE